MARIVKEHDERKKEFIETSLELFKEKGYNKVSVSMIIEKIGVAKGTFYHYFKSKKDIIEEIVEVTINELLAGIKNVMETDLSAGEKMKLIFGNSSLKSSDDILMLVHHEENKELHERLNLRLVKELTPVLSEIIKEGIEEKTFKKIDNIDETAEIFLLSSLFILDMDYYNWNQEETLIRMKVINNMFEKTLGAEEGFFNFL